jgi:hypothetical protein
MTVMTVMTVFLKTYLHPLLRNKAVFVVAVTEDPLNTGAVMGHVISNRECSNVSNLSGIKTSHGVE